MMSIVSAIILIGVLVLVHEFGHYLVARLYNIKVLKFSIGFGPKVFSFRGKETEYLISSVPLGGYVKLHGEDEDAEITEDLDRAFGSQPPSKRMMVVFAGPFFNFLFALLVFVTVNLVGYQTISSKVGEVKEGYPAYNAGIAKGDVIKSINDKNVRSWKEVSGIIKSYESGKVKVVFEREGRSYFAEILPRIEKGRNMFGEEADVPVVGIVSSDDLVKISYPPHRAVIEGGRQVYELVEVTVLTVYKLFKRTVPVSSLGGPILITKLAGETAKSGFMSFVMFTAFLSINLGVINLLPIPILDGGHIVMFAYEGIFKRKVSPRLKEIFAYIGIIFLALLTVVVFYNDIIRVFVKQ